MAVPVPTDTVSEPRPLVLVEDAAARRWVAERALRTPLMIAKFVAPLVVILAVGVLVYQRRVGAETSPAARAGFVLVFGSPFLLGLAYPVLRWWPQRWTIDAQGITAHGPRRGRVAWSELRWWGSAPIARVPGAVRIELAGATRVVAMIVPAARLADVEAWLRAAAPAAERRAPPRLR